MVGLFVLLGIGLAIAACGTIAATWWMITHPPRRTYSSAVARSRPGDPSELVPSRSFSGWTFEHAGQRLPLWDIPGDHPGGPTIVLLHGWGDSKIGALSRLPGILGQASRVLAIDLPGHGEATGRCSLGAGEIDTVVALMSQLSRDSDAGEQPSVVLFGWSLGAGLALAAAARAPEHVSAVIAEAPYRLAATPARKMLRRHGLPSSWNLQAALACLNRAHGGGLSPKTFDRMTLAQSLRCPVLVLHGARDEICPIEDGRQIAAAANARLVEIPAGGHYGLWTDPTHAAACTEAVRTFIRSLPTLR